MLAALGSQPGGSSSGRDGGSLRIASMMPSSQQQQQAGGGAAAMASGGGRGREGPRATAEGTTPPGRGRGRGRGSPAPSLAEATAAAAAEDAAASGSRSQQQPRRPLEKDDGKDAAMTQTLVPEQKENAAPLSERHRTAAAASGPDVCCTATGVGGGGGTKRASPSEPLVPLRLQAPQDEAGGTSPSKRARLEERKEVAHHRHEQQQQQQMQMQMQPQGQQQQNQEHPHQQHQQQQQQGQKHMYFEPYFVVSGTWCPPPPPPAAAAAAASAPLRLPAGPPNLGLVSGPSEMKGSSAGASAHTAMASSSHQAAHQAAQQADEASRRPGGEAQVSREGTIGGVEGSSHARSGGAEAMMGISREAACPAGGGRPDVRPHFQAAPLSHPHQSWAANPSGDGTTSGVGSGGGNDRSSGAGSRGATASMRPWIAPGPVGGGSGGGGAAMSGPLSASASGGNARGRGSGGGGGGRGSGSGILMGPPSNSSHAVHAVQPVVASAAARSGTGPFQGGLDGRASGNGGSGTGSVAAAMRYAPILNMDGNNGGGGGGQGLVILSGGVEEVRKMAQVLASHPSRFFGFSLQV